MEQFKRIDQGLKKYYESMGRKNYENEDGIGKFLEYCNDNQCEAEDIEDELSGDPSDCLYLEFDDNFPFTNDITNEGEKVRIMFDIIKKCYNNNQTNPSNVDDQISQITQWNLQLSNDDYKQYKDIYTKHCIQTAKTKIDDHTFWFGLCLSFKNNFPFLQYLSEIYIRENIQHMLQNSDGKSEYDLNTFIMNYKDVFINLSGAHNSITISVDEEKDQTLSVIEFIQSAINLYISRLLPPLYLPLPIGFGLIEDNISDIARVIEGVSIFCQRNDELRCPFQLDCVIACNARDDMNDSDDEEEKEGQNNCMDSIGDIWMNLEKNNCLYHISDNKQPIYTSKRINITFKDFKSKLEKKYNNIDAEYMNNYPQRRRVGIFIDNRKNINVLNNANIANKTIHSVTIFEPAFDVREFPNYTQNTKSVDIFEWCIEATRKCIIPCIGYPKPAYAKNKTKHNLLKTKNALTDCNGNLITFSFHVEQQNKIRCYMWWRGKCMLFLPQDIDDILPHIFTYGNKFKFGGYDSCKWRDETFEAIYQNVTHKNPIKHLRKYHPI